MVRRQKLKVTVKQSHQDHLMLLLPNLNEVIGADHPVRVVSPVLDKVYIRQLLAGYKGGGTTTARVYCLRYWYTVISIIYSSHKLEENVGRNIYFV